MKRTRDEWIRMDSGYLARIKERLPLIRDHAAETVGTGPIVNPVIEELYEEIMIKYLPKRYSTMFQVKGRQVLNLVTGSIYPLLTAGLTPKRMLELLGENVETSACDEVLTLADVKTLTHSRGCTCT